MARTRKVGNDGRQHGWRCFSYSQRRPRATSRCTRRATSSTCTTGQHPWIGWLIGSDKGLQSNHRALSPTSINMAPALGVELPQCIPKFKPESCSLCKNNHPLEQGTSPLTTTCAAHCSKARTCEYRAAKPRGIAAQPYSPTLTGA